MINIIKKQIKQFNMSEHYIDRSLAYIKENNVYLTDKHIKSNALNCLKLPDKLFCIGDDNLLNKRIIGIVGTRKPDIYARNILEKIMKKMDKNYITASGFAVGIDSLVHKLSLKYSIKTIAITGCGFAINYPAVNRALKTEIIKNGALLSEYSPFIKPYRANFLKRNMLIALISDIIIIIRGSKKSGTLSTLNHALQLNKKIYALPGDIDCHLSYAPNYALSKGAIPICDIDNLEFIKKRTKRIILNKEEKTLMKFIKTNNSINDLIKSKLFTREKIFSIIINLELKGIIKRELNSTIVILEDTDE